ncbi:MAG TPA: methylmalonyl-CoA mutase family protein, partial [Solirubrobacteraceae bacterium]|nr:methylmalonyl-CoA mutase family protein [Solirubrobacteraceae bacterium]
AKVDALGGSVNAIQFITGEIDESAWGYQERYRIGQDIVVGVNAYQEEDIEVPDLLRVDPESEREQLQRLAKFKADRDHALGERRLEELREAARGSDNLLPAIRQALKDRCSIGEVCGAMQDVFGSYAPTF